MFVLQWGYEDSVTLCFINYKMLLVGSERYHDIGLRIRN